jgi:hypothetical protein
MGLGDDDDIKVIPAEWWAYDYDRDVTTVPLIDLITAPLDKIEGSLGGFASGGRMPG